MKAQNFMKVKMSSGILQVLQSNLETPDKAKINHRHIQEPAQEMKATLSHNYGAWPVQS